MPKVVAGIWDFTSSRGEILRTRNSARSTLSAFAGGLEAAAQRGLCPLSKPFLHGGVLFSEASPHSGPPIQGHLNA